MARSNTPPRAAVTGVEPLGSIRRSQLVSTYGIGAIVDLEKGSFMPMGLEDWEAATRLPSLTLAEPRLQAMLKVDHFRLGPVKQDIAASKLVDARYTAPAVRFPQWHECRKCHRIGQENAPFELATDGARLTCNAHSGATVYTTPVRFVVACRRGHINDFPWSWWAHRGRAEGECENPSLVLKSKGESASLGDLYVECRSCRTNERATSQSLGQAFGGAALQGCSCSGFRPWLHDREAGCSENIQTLQRGASNVHFPVVCSALSIPPVSEAASQIVLELSGTLEAVPAEAIPAVLAGLAAKYGIAVEPLLGAWQHLQGIHTGATTLTERQARAEEYAALSEDREDAVIAGVVPQFMNEVFEPPASIARWFDLIGAASRLREIRALVGFSRIEPYPVSAEKVSSALGEGKLSPLSKGGRNWLPAAEIRGEGVFLRFREEAIDAWITANPGVAARARQMEARSLAVSIQRGYLRDYIITPRLLLVHSFSHALIRQISIECGYSASALRERLYISEADSENRVMNGVLIYTGSPDSEGSLGGLVRMARPEFLAPIILRTVAGAEWCGSDPVCLETDPDQSGDRISGAACHCCLLLPETACEKFNRELDRAVLIGDSEPAFGGFFGKVN